MQGTYFCCTNASSLTQTSGLIEQGFPYDSLIEGERKLGLLDRLTLPSLGCSWPVEYESSAKVQLRTVPCGAGALSLRTGQTRVPSVGAGAPYLDSMGA